MSIEQNNHGNEGATDLSSQGNGNIRLLGEDTCKTSPYFRVVLDIATSYNLIGPVVTEHEGQTLVFDFYNPKDGSLYKVFSGDHLDAYDHSQEYYRYTDYPGDVAVIVDMDKTACSTWKCRCCDHSMVQLPYNATDFSLDSDCTWVLSQGELCDYEREASDGEEVWHSIERSEECPEEVPTFINIPRLPGMMSIEQDAKLQAFLSKDSNKC